MLDHGTGFRSPGGSFAYVVEGPCCRIYDREELPWPCCSLSWHGKAPSWNREGRRFVADMAARRFPSYAVRGVDRAGATWSGVQTDYTWTLPEAERRWWYWHGPAHLEPPETVEEMRERLAAGHRW